jgi:hypothetical protein
MKPKIVLFLITLFFTAVGTQAQPDCREKFSPYNICNSDYAKADLIFFGEVVALDKKEIGKTLVQVKKIFKGKTSDKIELYLDIDIMCQGIPPVGSTQIYNVSETVVNGKTRYYSKYMSRPLTDYSAESLERVFNRLKDVLNNKKENILEGVIQETLDKLVQVELKNEELDKYDFTPRSWKPLSDVLIEVTNEQTGKTYTTKSKADGTYRINNIPPGKYKIRVNMSNKREFEREIFTDGSFCKRYQILILD